MNVEKKKRKSKEVDGKDENGALNKDDGKKSKGKENVHGKKDKMEGKEAK